MFSPEGQAALRCDRLPTWSLLHPPTSLTCQHRAASSSMKRRSTAAALWFYRLSPLKQPDQMIIGHLLVAQDWSDIREDLESWTLGSMAAAIVVVTLIAALIPLAIRRYISNPLRDLSRRVTRLSSGDELSRGIGGDEVKLLSEVSPPRSSTHQGRCGPHGAASTRVGTRASAPARQRIDLRRSAPTSPRASRTRSARQWE